MHTNLKKHYRLLSNSSYGSWTPILVTGTPVFQRYFAKLALWDPYFFFHEKGFGTPIFQISVRTLEWFSTTDQVLSIEPKNKKMILADYFVRSFLVITKTCLCNIGPLKPHFYTVKLGFTGVCIIFPISAQKHRLWYSLEPPRRGGSNEYPQAMF